MSHPYAHKYPGRSKAYERYATGGGIPGGKGPFPGQTEAEFVKSEQDRPRRQKMAPEPMGTNVGDSIQNAAHKEGID